MLVGEFQSIQVYVNCNKRLAGCLDRTNCLNTFLPLVVFAKVVYFRALFTYLYLIITLEIKRNCYLILVISFAVIILIP